MLPRLAPRFPLAQLIADHDGIRAVLLAKGHLPGVQAAKETIPLGTIDVLMTNPPFGSDIPVTEKTILEQYELARRWERQGDGFVMTNAIKPAVSPEVLFIERCVKWLKPGGRMGIVLPDGILGNPGDEYIRYWVLRHCWILASIDLPVESFIVEANVNIRACFVTSGN